MEQEDAIDEKIGKFPLSWSYKKYTIDPSTKTTIEDLVQDWKSGCKEYGDVNSNITDANFPTNSSNLPTTPCRVFLVNFDKPMTIERAIEEAEKYGLKLPTIQLGILLATQNPKLQKVNWIIIVPHEPWSNDFGYFFVLCLFSSSRRRVLDLGWCGRYWSFTDWFLFVDD